jgi:hypothetical protein
MEQVVDHNLVHEAGVGILAATTIRVVLSMLSDGGTPDLLEDVGALIDRDFSALKSSNFHNRHILFI